jgi:heme exporter protein B
MVHPVSSPHGDMIRPTPKALATTWMQQVWTVARKDLMIELRSGEVVVTGGFFAALVTVLSSLAYYMGPQTRNQVAAGVIWLATTFAAVLSLSRTWQREREEATLDALIVSPISASALYFGKALGILVFLYAIESVVVPLSALLFSIDIPEHALGLLAISALAVPGVAASGTLFGVMTVRTRARDLVLSICLFPLLAPTLMAATVCTRELLNGIPLSELTDYLQIMALFDLVFVVGGAGLFGSLAEQ